MTASRSRCGRGASEPRTGAACEDCQAYRATLRKIGLIVDLRGSSDDDKLADIGGELDARRAPIE